MSEKEQEILENIDPELVEKVTDDMVNSFNQNDKRSWREVYNDNIEKYTTDRQMATYIEARVVTQLTLRGFDIDFKPYSLTRYK